MKNLFKVKEAIRLGLEEICRDLEEEGDDDLTIGEIDDSIIERLSNLVLQKLNLER